MRSRPRLFRVSIAVFGFLLLAGCGDPWVLRGEIDQLVARERFGGSFARLYGTTNDDEFEAALLVDGELTVMGSAGGTGNRAGLIAAIDSTGSIVSQYLHTASEDLSFTTGELVAVDAILGSARWMAGGWYQTGTGRNGLVARLRTDTTEPFWVGAVGGDTSLEEVTDLVTDPQGTSHAVGNSNAVVAEGSMIYARFDSEGGRDRHTIFSPGVETSATAAVLADSGDVIVAGTIFSGAGGIGPGDISGLEVLLYRIDGETGAISGTPRSYGVGNGSADHAWDIARIPDPERFIVVGSTDAVPEFGTAWLVLMFDSDLALEFAYVVKINANQEGAARAIGTLPSDNYWGSSDVFVIAGDHYESVLLNAAGEIGYGATTGEGSTLLDGRANAVVPHNDSFDGMFVVGTNQATGSRGSEGAVVWSLPSDGSSEPEMTTTTETNPAVIGTVLDSMVVNTVTLTAYPVPGASTASVPTAFFTVTDAPLTIVE